jgi:DNA polymerase-3 subunit gamma/tau
MLSRAWQMLLKGLFEVRDATRPLAAAEMALIRLGYAADLPPTEKLVRDLLQNETASRPAPTGSPSRSGATPNLQSSSLQSPSLQSSSPQPSMRLASGPTARAVSEPVASPTTDAPSPPAILFNSLEDIAALAGAKGAQVLKVHIENDIHLVNLEQGKIEFRPSVRAPRTLAGDLAQKLKDWTGARWVVTVVRDGGAPTVAEQKRMTKAARLESVTQEPLVRAVLDRFPGAEVVAVRDLSQELPEIATDEDSSE